MPQIPLHTSSTLPATSQTTTNPLPSLLHTPSGVAILEIQGTIHFPSSTSPTTSVGKLVFPLYDSNTTDEGETKWTKRVYLYVGKHQRLTGEVKKLGKPFAVIRKRSSPNEDEGCMEDLNDSGKAMEDELEVVEVVKHKLVFSTRPEPVGGIGGAGGEEG